MNRPTKTVVRIAGIAVALSCLGGALAGCGGSDSDGGSAPKATGPSVAGFCETFAGLTTTLAQNDPKDPAATVKGIQDWVGAVEDYGTPSELSDEALDGFETLVATFKGIKDDATFKDLQGVVNGASPADNKKMEAFGAWASKNCTPAAPSDDAS